MWVKSKASAENRESLLFFVISREIFDKKSIIPFFLYHGNMENIYITLNGSGEFLTSLLYDILNFFSMSGGKRPESLFSYCSRAVTISTTDVELLRKQLFRNTCSNRQVSVKLHSSYSYKDQNCFCFTTEIQCITKMYFSVTLT